MFQLLLADGFRIADLWLWYAVPAILAVSLVYSATRHERMRPILVNSLRVAIWLVCFMLLVFVAIESVNWCVT